MRRLQSFSLNEPGHIGKLRQAAARAPEDHARQIAFGLALAGSGCSYEAASVLRPLRAHWKSSEHARAAQAAIDAQAWWSKHWKQFVQLKHAGDKDAALAMLGDRVPLYWDLPPLLMHLGAIAADDGHLDLASHLYARVADLAARGLPKMPMAAFAYVAESALIDVLCKQGNAGAALERHRSVKPNTGNAMAHEMQRAQLLVAVGQFDAAMQQVARILVTARKHRIGYSKTMRTEFIEAAPELAPLRQSAGWNGVLQDPEAYLRGTRRA